MTACAFALILGAGRAMASDGQAESQRLYLTKCSKCHRLYEPEAYDDQAWAGWMKKMKKKARLSDDQYKLISAYLDNLRKKSAE